MRIGVISDTHGVMHPKLFEHFEGVDFILYAGAVEHEIFYLE